MWRYLHVQRTFKCFKTNASWTSCIMFNFNWFNSNIYNFFLKNKMFSNISNFFNNILLNGFFWFQIASRIIMHVVFFWFVVLTLSNNDKLIVEFFFKSFNFCTIRESIFFIDKIVWCMCLFRLFDLSID